MVKDFSILRLPINPAIVIPDLIRPAGGENVASWDDVVIPISDNFTSCKTSSRRCHFDGYLGWKSGIN